jgi:tRNA(Ile)-lysidine synthase TilS/MesJ
MSPPRNRLQQRVFASVQRHHMLRPVTLQVSPSSGGADSVAFCESWKICGKTGVRLIVVHFNHQLRAAESMPMNSLSRI